MPGKRKRVSEARPRCSSCSEPPVGNEALRRGRCRRCYDAWVRSRPVGLGAICLGCNERRRDVLRSFELHRLWVVLCHNCAARAERLSPLPRSAEGLAMCLGRDRRWSERRAPVAGPVSAAPSDRRRRDRRVSTRNVFDADALVVIELEADYEHFTDGADAEVSITGIHQLAVLGR
jgi:hypothetical protein